MAHTSAQWMSVDGNFIYALDDDGQVNRFHAQVCGGYAGGARTPKGEIEANTRLMLAAPDLLAALQGVLRVVDCATDEFDAARAAIKLATDKP